jgi:ParB family chromosome partitioning protein
MELLWANPRTIKINPNNPRRTKATPEQDASLLASVQTHGIFSPPLCRKIDGVLVIRYGERRLKAAIKAGIKNIQYLLIDTDEDQDPNIALQENLMRAQMNPVDQFLAIEALIGIGWTEETIAASYGYSVRYIRKLRLCASVLPAMLKHWTVDLPREADMRAITAATQEEQEEVWKACKPKKSETADWSNIARCLTKRKIKFSLAKFDDALAAEYGVLWTEDLFAPAGEESRTTTNIEEFFAAQLAWLENNLPENGVVLAYSASGGVVLPPRAANRWGNPQEGDMIGYYISEHTGEVRTANFYYLEKPEEADTGSLTTQPTAKPPRAPISQKGVDKIGEMRTEALRTAVLTAEMDDTRMMALLVLTLAAGKNVRTEDPDKSYGTMSHTHRRAAIGVTLLEGDVITNDPETVRTAARDVLATILSCKSNYSNSGAIAMIAGIALDADRHLPTMATEDFLSCLSKDGIANAARGVGIQPRNTGKEMRAALITQASGTTYVLPEARFGLNKDAIDNLANMRHVADMLAQGSTPVPVEQPDEAVPGVEDEPAAVPDTDPEAPDDTTGHGGHDETPDNDPDDAEPDEAEDDNAPTELTRTSDDAQLAA